MMPTLIIGASGATGKRLVQQLLDDNHSVRVIVRRGGQVPAHANLEEIIGEVGALSVEALQEHVKGCGAVVSCLGHNMTFKGIYRDDHLLVTNAVGKLCAAVAANEPPAHVKYVLMNTVGNRNMDPEANEVPGLAQRFVIGLVRWLVPPHNDNEQAAEYLRTKVGKDHDYVEWSVVRPDDLTDDEHVTPHWATPSPAHSLFDSQKTSRANVAAFIKTLVTDDDVWGRWKGKMPVVYDGVEGGGGGGEEKEKERWGGGAASRSAYNGEEI